ncbi:MAG TPA: ComEC/Rec2 family competence protein [Solirubrobacteraceae bacterium]|nr:ComEC/Rec2 family competence protein [Solirubrobacteraceae bacterium]
MSVVAAAVRAASAHPRHLLLGGVVTGLVAGPVARELAAAAAALVGLALVRRPGLALAATAAVLGGALVADARLQALDRTALRPSLGHVVDVRADLLEAPRRAASGSVSARARLTSGRGRGEQIVVRVTKPRFGASTRWPALAVGAGFSARGRLVALRPVDDFQRRRGAHAVLLARAIRATGGWRGGVAGALDGARSRAEAGVAAGLRPGEAALARGMVLGEDERLAEPVRDDFRRSGLAHLLAASGQNVMLLAALALPLLAALGLGLRARLTGAMALVAAYVPLAGAGPSIQRAGVMGAAGLLAALAGRPSSRVYALLLAAALTLVLNPRAAGDPGWQLSFAAVVAILALSGHIRDALVARRIPGPVADAGAITAAATLGTAPLLAFHFGRVSLASLPANLLAAPAVAPIMWLGMIAAALGQVAPALAVPVNALAAVPLAYLQWLAHAAASAPAAAVDLRLGSPAAVAAAYGGLMGAAVLLARRRRLRRARPAMLGLGAAALASIALAIWIGTPGGAPGPPPPGQLRLSFLDVGQGDATLVQHAGAAVLVDTGPPDGPILARLRAAGVRSLDVLVVTHAQADHEGGAGAVLSRYPVRLLVDGGDGAATPAHRAIGAAAARRGVRVVAPDAGQRVRAGPIRLDVLWPHAEAAERHAGQDPNRRAIVARLVDGSFTAFLPADAASDVFGSLDLEPVTALKVAHHGSADAGLAEALARLRPQVAAIEVGRHNPYGHPTAQALGALHAVPRIYRTDRDGTVRVTVEHGRVTVTTDG